MKKFFLFITITLSVNLYSQTSYTDVMESNKKEYVNSYITFSNDTISIGDTLTIGDSYRSDIYYYITFKNKEVYNVIKGCKVVIKSIKTTNRGVIIRTEYHNGFGNYLIIKNIDGAITHKEIFL